jgi:hypothetical protein
LFEGVLIQLYFGFEVQRLLLVQSLGVFECHFFEFLAEHLAHRGLLRRIYFLHANGCHRPSAIEGVLVGSVISHLAHGQFIDLFVGFLFFLPADGFSGTRVDWVALFGLGAVGILLHAYVHADGVVVEARLLHDRDFLGATRRVEDR